MLDFTKEEIEDFNSRKEYNDISKDRCPEDSLFVHLVISEHEYDRIGKSKENLFRFADFLDLTLISVERDGKFNYIHVAPEESLDFISNNGIVKKISDGGRVKDLGEGIYVVNKEDDRGIDNLFKFACYDDSEIDNLTLVEGVYEGKYNECIFGYGHVGYIVIKDINCLGLETIDNLYVKSIYDL